MRMCNNVTVPLETFAPKQSNVDYKFQFLYVSLYISGIK
jgi:hypothetical protein